MFPDQERRAVIRAARCFHSLSGSRTLHAMAAPAGLKRLQDAFAEHIEFVREVSRDAAAPGIALFWVPPECRGDFTSDDQVRAACAALEAENPSLKDSFTVLWPGSADGEVAAAWRHLRDLDWSTKALLGTLGPVEAAGTSGVGARCVDVVGETYETLKAELGSRDGASRGEFFTPESIGWLKVELTNPQPCQSVNDCCCGSGRLPLLAAAHVIMQHGLFFQETGPDHPLGPGHRLVVPPPLAIVGQDIAAHGPAMARISLTALGYLNAVFVVRDSLSAPATLEEATAIVEDRGRQLLALHAHHVVTDPPPAGARTPILDTTPPASGAPPPPEPAKRVATRGLSLDSFAAPSSSPAETAG